MTSPEDTRLRRIEDKISTANERLARIEERLAGKVGSLETQIRLLWTLVLGVCIHAIQQILGGKQ
jgi:tetrahydromethanopterin S-methyltransferase subunit G